MVEKKPDITFFMKIIAHLAKNSSHTYTEAVKTILCYFKGLIDYGIRYKGDKENPSIEGYLDSD